MGIADTLIVVRMNVDDTLREISGWSTDTMPTLINCQKYRRFIWTGVKTGDAPIQYVLRAGNPSGWQYVITGVLDSSANSWFRVEISLPQAWERYRFEVATTTPQQLRCKIAGVGG